MLAICAAPIASGCYTYRGASGTTPPVGAAVAVDINDRGRVALADSLGPSPERVEGRLVSADDSTVVVAVASVKPRDGERTSWTGERITLNRSSFGDMLERRLSVARSVALAGAVVGGVVAFFVTRDLVGDSDGSEGDRRPGGPGNDQ